MVGRRLHESLSAAEEERINRDLIPAEAAAACQVDFGVVGGNVPPMIVVLDAKRRVSIPAALAPASPGDQFDASFDPDEDTIILRRVKRKSNWLDVWRQCPLPMDDLPTRRRQMPRKPKP